MPKFKRISAGLHHAKVEGELYTLEYSDLSPWKMTMADGQTHDVQTIKAANVVLEFHILASNYLRQIGATYVKRLHHWHLETLHGQLQITLYDTWVAMRFRDVERAKKRFSSDFMNQHSGKWNLNWHTTKDPKGRFMEFKMRILGVTCAPIL